MDRLLFLAQLEKADFFDRALERPETDPQVYVSECADAIFSLVKKEYAPKATRARAATARLAASQCESANFNDPTILDAALREGASPPFGP